MSNMSRKGRKTVRTLEVSIDYGINKTMFNEVRYYELAVTLPVQYIAKVALKDAKEGRFFGSVEMSWRKLPNPLISQINEMKTYG